MCGCSMPVCWDMFDQTYYSCCCCIWIGRVGQGKGGGRGGRGGRGRVRIGAGTRKESMLCTMLTATAVIWICMGWKVGLGLYFLMTPGPSTDIQCHADSIYFGIVPSNGRVPNEELYRIQKLIKKENQLVNPLSFSVIHEHACTLLCLQITRADIRQLTAYGPS